MIILTLPPCWYGVDPPVVAEAAISVLAASRLFPSTRAATSELL